MISYLQGRVIQVQQNPPRVVILTASGVGYTVTLPVFVEEAIAPHEDQELGLHIYYSVSERQPLPILVGFDEAGDRDFFEQFIQVEGIGPARAASALTMPVPTLAYAIETEDLVTLTLMPGIGQRGAQKIVATLKGKVSESASRPIATATQRARTHGTRADVVEVLVNLGYRNNEAVAMVDEAIKRDPDLVEDSQALLRDVFRNQPATSAVSN